MIKFSLLNASVGPHVSLVCLMHLCGHILCLLRYKLLKFFFYMLVEARISSTFVGSLVIDSCFCLC
jgi:hypothetical protein